MTRQTLTEAVKLAVCIDRGYYTGTVLREKQGALESLTQSMSTEELNEYNGRIK